MAGSSQAIVLSHSYTGVGFLYDFLASLFLELIYLPSRLRLVRGSKCLSDWFGIHSRRVPPLPRPPFIQRSVTTLALSPVPSDMLCLDASPSLYALQL